MDPLVWSIVLLLLGLLFLVLEIFIPSGGVLGVLAAVSLVAAVGVGFQGGLWLGTAILAATIVIVPGILSAAVRFWPHTPLGKLILIRRPKHPDDVLPESGLSELVGRRGRAKSKMLPSGAVSIDGQVYDAVSRGMAIDSGQAIEVVAVRTNRVVVQPCDERLLASPEEVEEAEILSRPLDSLGLDPLDDPLA